MHVVVDRTLYTMILKPLDARLWGPSYLPAGGWSRPATSSSQGWRAFPLNIYCNTQIFGPLMGAFFFFRPHKVNSNYLAQQKIPTLTPMMSAPPCNREENCDLCYPQMGWVDTYFNQPSVKVELGVSLEREFTQYGCESSFHVEQWLKQVRCYKIWCMVAWGGCWRMSEMPVSFFLRLFSDYVLHSAVVVRMMLVMCCAIDGSQIGWRWALLLFLCLVFNIVAWYGGAFPDNNLFWWPAAFCVGLWL